MSKPQRGPDRMTQEDQFAEVIRTLGRGPSRSRNLTQDEAREAMNAVLRDEVDPLQAGAFLLLLRYRGENAAELAGFVEAGRATFQGPGQAPRVDLDWPTYADRHRQQPYFVLAARLLADHGVKVLMHGIAGFSDGFAPTRPVLHALGVPVCHSLDEAATCLATENLAYIGLEDFCPAVERLIALRPKLGVRTVANSFARALNPLGAAAQLQAVTHPPFRALQQEAAVLLGQPRAAVFKGIGGEAQCNPLKTCLVAWARDGISGEDDWPPIRSGSPYPWRDEPLDPERVAAMWRGELDLPLPAASVIATTAIGLWLTGRAASPAEADSLAEKLWDERDRTSLGPTRALSA